MKSRQYFASLARHRGSNIRLYKSLIHNYPMKFHNLAMRRANSWMEAINSHAVADAMVCSKSLASRRLRFSQASVRSTNQRRGRTTKPFATSDRLTRSEERRVGKKCEST